MRRLQMAADAGETTANVALYSAEREGGLFGYLGVGQVAQIGELDDPSGSFGEGFEGVCDEHAVAHAIHIRFNWELNGFTLGASRCVALLGSDVVDEPVLGDPHEPTGEAALGGVESVSGPPGADEYLLGDVLGAVLAQGAATEGVHQRAVGVIGAPKRVVVPSFKCCLNGIDNSQLCR